MKPIFLPGSTARDSSLLRPDFGVLADVPELETAIAQFDPSRCAVAIGRSLQHWRRGQL